MLYLRRVRMILGIAGFLAAMQLSQQVSQSQPIFRGDIKDPKEKDEPRTDAFDFHQDTLKAPRIIESVLKHLKPDLPADEWKDIIINLQSLLDDPANRLVEWTDPMSTDKKPHTVRSRKVGTILIGRFSKQGRDFYQSELGPAAEQKLKEAVERGDIQLLGEVSARYFHTKAGAEATILLARNHLDRGRYESAVEMFRRFMERNQEDPVPARVNFLAAISCKRLAILAAAQNDKDGKEIYQKLAEQYWNKVKKEVGTKKYVLGDGREVTLAQLEVEFNRPIQVTDNRMKTQWPLARGNPQNNGLGVGSQPFLDPVWQFSMTPILEVGDRETKGAGMAWIEQNLNAFLQSIDHAKNHTAIPALFPVAAPGKVIFRTYDGVYCVATRDDWTQAPPVKAGERLWSYECLNSLFGMISDSGSKNIVDSWLNSYYKMTTGLQGIFFENGLIGTLSHDGSLVYYVDDMAIPPPPMPQYNQINGMPMASYGPVLNKMVSHNTLSAVDLETGKLKWKAGELPKGVPAPVKSDDEKESALSLLLDCYFLGAPLPLAGKLYVVIEKDHDLRLVCLDPTKVNPKDRHPELVWSQPLGSPATPLPGDLLRRIQGISLAYSDNMLVVPTNAGAVLGVDRLSHDIVWARSYRQATNLVDPNQQQMFDRRGRLMGVPASQQMNADRWRNSAPIIVNGKVIFSSYDANSVLCLNLRDGEVLWEATRSSDDLYVAGVFDNKVLIAGKSGLKFLDLHKGNQVGMVNTGPPSGMGAASNDIYFLPVKSSKENPKPEILSIDIKEMKVVAHTSSRKNVTAGNLLFFDGAVFSQSPLLVTAFPQLDVKIAEATKLLAANPNDPVGLAGMGDLQLDKGHEIEAIDLYNKCLSFKPDVDTKAKAREKLYDAITQLLQKDFNAGEKMLDQYKDLCEVEILATDDALKKQIKADEALRRKANYFCLVAKGRENQGKLEEAFDNYKAFGTLTGNKELMSVIDQPNTQARPDVWALGRISHMMSKATPIQRKPLEERAARDWEKVKNSGNLEDLRDFVHIFGTVFSTGNEARLLLAEKLIATNNEEDLRDAENILLGLRGLDEPTYAARATEALARLYIRKGLFEDAMGLYAELNRNYGKVVVRAGQTGSDVFNDLVTDKRFLPYLEPPRESWMNSRFKAQEVSGFSGNQQQQSFTIAPDGESIPFYNRYKIVMDMMHQGSANWVLKVIDRTSGEQRFASQPLQSPSYLWNQPYSNNHRFAQIRGHLLILNLNQKVFAFDLADRKKLWEYDLFGKTPMPNSMPVRTENEADGVRLYYQDGWTQKVGQVGIIESGYVCLITRDGLVAVDPAKGTPMWTKSNVSARVQLMGDDNFVFVFESNTEGAVTSVRAIRAGDGVEVPIPDSSPVFSNLKKSKVVGRRVLVLDEKDGKKSMRLYDILTGKDDWKKQIDGNAILMRCEDPTLAGYVSDKGDVVILSVKDGKEIFTSKLDKKKLAQHMEKVDSVVLLSDRERFFVILNRPGENNNMYSPIVVPGIRTLRVNGHMYCFDRTTQKRLWFTDEQLDNQQIILDQFKEMPIVLGANYYNRLNNGLFDGNGLRVIALDKRSGAALFRKEVSQGQPFHALNSDPRTGTVELIRADVRIKFSPEENKPAAP